MAFFNWDPYCQQYRRSIQPGALAIKYAYDPGPNVSVVDPKSVCANVTYDPVMPNSFEKSAAQVDSATGPGPVDAAGGHAKMSYDFGKQVVAIIPLSQSANIASEPVPTPGQRDLAAYDDSGRGNRIEIVQPPGCLANMTFDSPRLRASRAIGPKSPRIPRKSDWI